ncbi:MAG: ParM/StbA family protein [Anaerolineae bacterium]|nr:ParM/StbA family protein [Anaerolineae bacterium]
MTQESKQALRGEITGVDFGAGALKIYSRCGGIELPSHVALGRRQRQARVSGLRAMKPPMQIVTALGRFYLGLNAHDWGRPVENLADDRFLGAPEVAALFYGGMTAYARQYSLILHSIQAVVGLTQSAFTEDAASNVVAGVRGWLLGSHGWQVEDAEKDTPSSEAFQLAVESVDVTSQAAGTMFDYFLDDQGEFIPSRKPAYKQEIGIVSVGMNTLELLVIRNGAPVERFLASETAGVRRLLEIIDPSGMYSRGELDTQLRLGKLNYADALPAWTSEIGGHIERRWGNAFRRFATTIVVGGGALILKDALTTRFNGKAFVTDAPIMAVARGLYKLGMMQQKRKRRRSQSER